MEFNSLFFPYPDPLMSALILLFSLLALLLASITDLKTREVPDFLNYGLMGLGLLLNTLLSILFRDYHFILNSILGLSLCFGIGWLMFYFGQWGGGDSKMLMGLGALFGIPFALKGSFLLSFLGSILLAGALYGLGWSIYLIFRDRKRFLAQFRKKTRTKTHNLLRMIFLGLLAVSILLIIFPLELPFKLFGIWICIISPLIYYLALGMSCIEKSSMLILTHPDKVTEGDWVAKNVVISGKTICGPKDLGISKNQIRLLKKFHSQGKIKNVLIKQGIPFIPSFLLAFFFTFFFGNPLMFILALL